MNYYNEFLPEAAEWIRELIKARVIAPGHVDERSITEVSPHDLKGYKQAHFFAGIGGWSYAFRLAGIGDDEEVDSCSCPCQPLSGAGLGKGHADERHLWPAFFRIQSVRRATKIIGELGASGLGREWLAGIRADLEELGYACGAADLCSAGAAAPNLRQRLYWLADSGRERRASRPPAEIRKKGRRGNVLGTPLHGDVGGMVDAELEGLEGHSGHVDDRDEPGRLGAVASGSVAEAGDARRLGGVDSSLWTNFNVAWCRNPDGGAPIPRRFEPGSFPLAARFPGRVGLLRGYGNAINPELAAIFIKAALNR